MTAVYCLYRSHAGSTADFSKHQDLMYRYGTLPELNPLLDSAVQYPWVEHKLQRLYYQLVRGVVVFSYFEGWRYLLVYICACHRPEAT